MCHNFDKHLLLVFSFFILSINLSFAQNATKENAPYSRFGIGEFKNPLDVSLKGMGSISTAYSNAFVINSDNPASFAALKLSTISLGGEGRMRTEVSNNVSYKTGTATVSYLTVGMPITKHSGLALGLQTNTHVYYKMTDTANVQFLGPSIRTYGGDGGTNYAFLGYGYKFKKLSVGLNMNYLFGTIHNASDIQKLYDSVNAMNSDFSRFQKVGGIYWKLGALYETPLNQKVSVRIGSTISFSKNINTTYDQYSLLWRSFSGITITDTAEQKTGAPGSITMPLSYAIGVQFFELEKWNAGLDFSAAKWSQFRVNGEKDSTADMSYKIGVGGEYTPNSLSTNNRLQRSTYRFGFYYGKDYIMLGGKNMNYFAFTGGLTLPFHRPISMQRSYLHFAFEVGKRGIDEPKFIMENFVRFSFGFTLNDKWFVKRRYE